MSQRIQHIKIIANIKILGLTGGCTIIIQGIQAFHKTESPHKLNEKLPLLFTSRDSKYWY